MLKKLISLITITALCFSTGISTFAESNTKDQMSTVSVEDFDISSEEFPDAYIEKELIPVNSFGIMGDEASDNCVRTIAATVYFEEGYKIEDNGEIVITKSELLSKDKVDEIGKENFIPIENPKDLVAEEAASTKALASTTTNNARGKLTMKFTVTNSGTNKYTLLGTSTWSANNSSDGENYPAPGNDFAGFTWGGQFDTESASVSAKDNFGYSRTVYLSDSIPNCAHVWEYYEGTPTAQKIEWANITNNAVIYKNTLTGVGNTTSFIYKYIHTYQKTVGTISISASSSGVAASFSLGNTSKQWSLVCTISGYKY
jgi:hypothetical protein